MTVSVNKDVSSLQEKQLAQFLEGDITSGSGCGKFNGGDVVTEDFLIECKTVTKPQTSFSVKREWLDKVAEQSFEQGKQYSALAIRFDPNENMDYIVISRDLFKELISRSAE